MTGNALGNYNSGIVWKNKAQVKIALDEVSKKNQIFVKDCLDAILGKFIWEIGKRIPRDTGEYAHSWYAIRQATAVIFKTELTALANWLEISGVKSHWIYPLDPTGYLHWIDKSGVEHFAKKVYHTGFNPKPHILPAKRETQREAKWIILAVARTHFKFLQKTIQGSKNIDLNLYLSLGRDGRIH
jgi:hypothetical protein